MASRAVSDIKFKNTFPQKMKKKSLTTEIAVEATRDILKSLGQKKGNKILVGFAAETEQIEENALQKVKNKNLDFIVANNVNEEGRMV